jgi:NADPH:quinone reductase-like Zn-dependent oxidoreductase
MTPTGLLQHEGSSLGVGYQMLHRTTTVRKGERLLVHGAAGGVGTAVLQLGRIAGLEMYGTGSVAQAGVISSLGADADRLHQGQLRRPIGVPTNDHSGDSSASTVIFSWPLSGDPLRAHARTPFLT